MATVDDSHPKVSYSDHPLDAKGSNLSLVDGKTMIEMRDSTKGDQSIRLNILHQYYG